MTNGHCFTDLFPVYGAGITPRLLPARHGTRAGTPFPGHGRMTGSLRHA